MKTLCKKVAVIAVLVAGFGMLVAPSAAKADCYGGGGWGGGGYYHDTSHYDYHPGGFQQHGDHFHYVPGHYDYHQTGHYHR